MTTVIVINAVLAAAAVYGIVLLLAAGIRSDRQPPRNVRTLPAGRRSTRQLAA